LIALYMLCDVFGLLASPRSEHKKYLRRLECLGLVLAACLLVSLVNPYGWGIYSYILKYLTANKTVLAATMEYQPTVLNGDLQPACFEILIAAAVIALAFAVKRPPLSQVLILLVFGHMALTSIRSIPLFVTATLPIIAASLSKARFLPSSSP